MCPACDMPSFAPCLHEEAETRIVLRKQLKGYKKISSYAVDTDLVVLVIPVVQHL